MGKIDFNVGQVLSRQEAKAINAGAGGSRCVLYCCDSTGNCTEQGITLPVVTSCSSNEQCQSLAQVSEYTCKSTDPGIYVAAHCKG